LLANGLVALRADSNGGFGAIHEFSGLMAQKTP